MSLQRACVQQGSILGPIMFNIYINIFFTDNVCLSNYANDTTLYSNGENHNTNTNISNNFIIHKIVFMTTTWY